VNKNLVESKKQIERRGSVLLIGSDEYYRCKILRSLEIIK